MSPETNVQSILGLRVVMRGPGLAELSGKALWAIAAKEGCGKTLLLMAGSGDDITTLRDNGYAVETFAATVPEAMNRLLGKKPAP